VFGLNNFITAGEFFIEIAGELIVIFVLVSFVIGLLTEYLPPSQIRVFLSNRFTWVQYSLGSGLGAITPFCSCSTVPITAGLLKGGVPFGPTMAFLFSSPVLNPVIFALLLSLFGVKITAVYCIVTFVGSMATAASLSRLGMASQVKSLMNIQTGCCEEEKKPVAVTLPQTVCCSTANQPFTTVPFANVQAQPEYCANEKSNATQASPSACCSASFETNDGSFDSKTTFNEKMKRASVSAIGTFKGVFWYLLIGAGIGAFIYGFFPQDLVVTLAGPGNPWSIPVAAAMGVPMYIRAETVIPISAALVGKGMGVGTVLALIIGGAGASIPEMILLGSMFKRKLVVAFVLNVFAIAIIAGYMVDHLVY
jgi:uncharacterized protein